MKPLYIIGAGGFGREVAWLVERINEKEPIWDIRGFIDDNVSLYGNDVDAYKVVGNIDSLLSSDEHCYALIAIGNAEIRKEIALRFKNNKNIELATVVDPSVQFSKRVCIGKGSIICAGNILTTDINIGENCIINLSCTLGHDVVIGDCVTIYPGVNVSGAVTVGSYSEIGTRTAIIQGVSIGEGSIIGANSTVIRDIEPYVTAVGSPARVVKRNPLAANRGGCFTDSGVERRIYLSGGAHETFSSYRRVRSRKSL